MKKLSARAQQGAFRGDGDGPVLVDQEAPALLWLVGAATAEEVAIVSAWDGTAAAPATKCLAMLEAALPEGLELLGAFAAAAGQGPGGPAWPREVPEEYRRRLRFLAARGDGGELVLWDVSADEPKLLGNCSLDPSEHWPRVCCRGRLSIWVAGAGARAARQLEGVAQQLEAAVRFRMPGQSQLATLAELRASRAALSLPPGAAGGGGSVVSVPVLAEDLGAGGPTNFADLKTTVPALYALDFAAYLPSGCKADEAASRLLAAAQRQLQAAIAEAGEGGAGLAFRCFSLDSPGHVMCLPGTEDLERRKSLHRLLRLPSVPLLRPDCAVPWAGQPHPRATGKPVNPHADCGPRPSWWKGGEETRSVFVRGIYEYFHYLQDKFDDNGWGCFYRATQTCVSWYRLQGYSEKSVPSILDIQELLKKTDHMHKDLKIGSKTWIGTVEGMNFLREYLGVEGRRLNDCSDVSDFKAQVPQMFRHFESEGAPILLAIGDYAYTLVGLCYDAASGEVAFMIVDPHYTGADELKTILHKGWVGWKKLDFIEKTAAGGSSRCFMPFVPKGDETI